MLLAPPPLLARKNNPSGAHGELGTVGSQLSFQATSGIYPFTETPLEVFVLLQKVASRPFSSNSVPPTAVLKDVEAMPLTAKPCVAGVGCTEKSHPAAPLSPEATITLIPWAAACCQSPLKNAFSAAPRSDSQAPKLTLITGARSWSTM